jgi:hypothetical protein
VDYKTTALPLSYASPRKVSQSREGQSTTKDDFSLSKGEKAD